ncbi:MAG: enolase C-terminal domain-like protein, partial [Candidatus Nanoarchaeia archaeon]
TNIGDEGGFAPPLTKHTQPLDLIEKAVKACGYKKFVAYGIDAAASEFYEDGKYYLDDKPKTAKKMVEIYKALVKKYNIISIEDPFHEEDFESFAQLTKTISKKCQVVGDDLLVTNPGRIHQAQTSKSCTALLLKVNQIGTVTEAIGAAGVARQDRWKIMVSHRSGETSDSFIADLAVGLGATQIKSGAPCRGERLAKYNQLLRIEEESKIKLGKF